jgi:hypothetical protein
MRRHMLIRVLYQNDKYDYVADFVLDELIATGKVKKFQRSDGWVTIGQDAIRGVGGNRYGGPERRRFVVAK